ncbi:carbohydrate ABC transporter permease [Paenibacillus planticolens]|uniref:carbohydrate ABC transporter permease n=1 Tax=Paenibacillus planticolens TaxID=2654976 RepID=UPI0014929DA2|nr:carbohydrate ABC transporter permease [Paenibacillus planticolens]
MSSHIKSYNKTNYFAQTVLIIGAIAMLVPFIWMVLTSFKTVTETTQIPFKYFPSHINAKSFPNAWKALPFTHLYLNTIIAAFFRTVGPLIFSSMAAYAFAKIVFPAKNFLFFLVLSVMLVPNPVFYTPQYFILNKLHLINTVPALFITGLVSPFATFLLRQFFLGLPKELEEAAILDGCNHYQTLRLVLLPLVTPALAAVAIIHTLWTWNEFTWPFIVNSSPDKLTLATGLRNLVGQYQTDYPTLMAGAIMAIIPMLIVFIIFQKRFIEGVAFTGLK